jgi:Fe(3+) dicitrate transport protein
MLSGKSRIELGALVGISVLAMTMPGHAEDGADVVVPAEPTVLAAVEPVYDRIVVIGSASDAHATAGSAQYISEVELEKFEYQDVNRILRAVPGVNLQEEDGFGLRPNIGLRGTGLDRSSKIAILEDGVLAAPAPYAAPSAYYFPVAGRMHAVEIVKGASAVKYGPLTTGGAVNLFSTAIPEAPEARLTAKAGTDNYAMLHGVLGTTFDVGGMELGALLENYHVESEGFKKLDSGGSTGFNIDDFVGKLSLGSGSGASIEQKIELKLQYSDELSDETYLGLTDADFAVDPFRRYSGSQLDQMDSEHNTYQLTHTIDLPGDWDMTTVAYRTQFQRNWFKLDKVDDGGGAVSISNILADPATNAGAYEILQGADGFISADDALQVKNNNRAYMAQGIQVILGYQKSIGTSNHQIELSARYHEDEMDRYQWVDAFRMDSGAMILTTAGEPGTDSNRIETAQAWSFFLRDEIYWGDWSFVPGVRYESIELKREDFGKTDPGRTGDSLTVLENSVNVFIPGFGFTYQLSEEVLLLGGVHKGFTHPAPGSTADAEESINYEWGARFEDTNLMGDAILFYNTYSNLVGSCTASTGGDCIIGDQFDGGEVEVFGLEMSGLYDFGQALDLPVSIPVTLAYTYTRAEFQNAFTSGYKPWGTVEIGDEMPYIPEHQLNIGIGIEADDWRVNFSANRLSKTRSTAGHGAILDGDQIGARTIVDASFEFSLTDRIDLSVSAENIFDEIYIASRSPAGLRPGKPQTFFAGVRLAF